MILQVSPTEWKPSETEMKKADLMDPGNEPKGLMEVIVQMLSLLHSATGHCRSMRMPSACRSMLNPLETEL